MNRKLINGQNGEVFLEASGLKGQQDNSPGQRPGGRSVQLKNAPKGQKQFNPNDAFALTGRYNHTITFTQGVALGY